jgi:hypothetical protein
MVSELDFEEIDQVMEDMTNQDGITDAIAADVAKIENVVKKTTKKKVKDNRGNVVKNTTEKAAVKTGKTAAKSAAKPAEKPVEKVVEKTTEKPTEKPADDGGEIVLVKVKKKPAPEPEEIVYQPNPKTGKFMDIVSPLSDMSIQGARPLKSDVKNQKNETLLITETSVVAIAPIVADEDDTIEKDDLVADRERIEEAGLDPDAAIGDLTDQLEEIADDDADDDLDDILQSFDSDTETEVADEVADEAQDELEKLADILDMPDHTEAFLENVEVAKRPLGGGEEAVSSMGAAAIADTEFGAADSAEMKADTEFLEDTRGLDEWLDNTKPSKPKADKRPSKIDLPAPTKKGSNVVLYVLLVVLFVILGASLGALAYFSGLF